MGLGPHVENALASFRACNYPPPGTVLGEGDARVVFAVGEDHSLVLKVAKTAGLIEQNKNEVLNWQYVSSLPKETIPLARVVAWAPNYSWVLMERVKAIRLHTQDWFALPYLYRSIDLAQCGKDDTGKIKFFDYGGILFSQNKPLLERFTDPFWFS
jgi:hypothetical protein